MNLKGHKLLEETDAHFHVRSPDGGAFKVAKAGLRHGTVQAIQQHFAGEDSKDAPETQEVQPDDPLAQYEAEAQGREPVKKAAEKKVPTAEDIEAATQRDFRASPAGAALGPMGSQPQDYKGTVSAPAAAPYMTGADVDAATAAAAGVTQPPGATAPATQPPPQTSGDPFTAQHIAVPPMPGEDPRMRAAQQREQAAIEQQGRDTAEMYKRQAQAAEQARVALERQEQERVAETTSRAQQFEQERQGILSTKIDPTHYWSSKSGAQKAASVIGMILGGIGSGLVGGENPAERMLEREMNADIRAQEANLGTRKSMLSDYLAQTRDLASARALTYAHKLNATAAQMQQIALASGSKTAIDTANVLGAQLQQRSITALQEGVARKVQMQNAELERQLKINALNIGLDQQKAAQAIAAGGRRGAPAGANGAAGPYGIYLTPEAAASPAMDAVMPSMVKVKSDGSGDQYRKLLDPKTREKVIDKLQTADQAEAGFKRLAQIAATHPSGTWSPEANAEARSLSNILKVGFFSSQEDQKRFTENEQHALDQAIADPTSFWKSAFGGNTGALNAVQRILHTHRASVLNNYTLGKPIPMSLPGDK